MNGKLTDHATVMQCRSVSAKCHVPIAWITWRCRRPVDTMTTGILCSRAPYRGEFTWFSFKFYSTFIIRISQKLILKSNYLNYIALHVCLQILIIIEGKCDMKNSFYLTRGLISLMSNRSLGSFLFLNVLASVRSTVSKSLYYYNWIVYFFKNRRN